MRRRRPFLSWVYGWLRLLLIVMGGMVLSACTWSELVVGPELDPIEVIAPIEATDLPNTPAAPRTQTINAPDDVSGEWVGVAFLDDGTELYYELELTQDGTEVFGIARASDEEGAASVDVRGTYEDGHLQLDESGGETSGNWEELCYWRLDLRVVGTSLRMRLEGPFEGIPNSAGTCTTTGEISLSRQ